MGGWDEKFLSKFSGEGEREKEREKGSSKKLEGSSLREEETNALFLKNCP